MKTKIQLLILTTFTILLISCSRNNNDVEGTYYNTDKEFNYILDKIKFKDGYYYNVKTGKGFKYKIEGDKIIVGNYGMQFVYKIIDNETIEFGGMEFKKGVVR